MKKDFFNTKAGVRLFSLFIAIFLYVFVTSENNAYRFQSAANQQFASINSTETLSNVPVSVGSIPDDMFISGLPESVQVRLTGPKNIVNQVIEKNIMVETEDLRGKEPGSQYIRLVIPDLPSSIEYQITPSQRYVRLSKLKSITREVEYDLDRRLTMNGFEVMDVALNPETVELVGDSDIIDQIERVYITISNALSTTESFTETYALQIEDADGNILDVNPNVSEIEATVTIARPTKEIGLNLVPVGEDLTQYHYEYHYDTSQAYQIEGYESFIVQIANLDVMVDVTGMTHTQTVTGEVQVPRGVEFVGDPWIPIEVTIVPLASYSSTPPETSESYSQPESNDESRDEVSSDTIIHSSTDEVEDENENQD